MTDALLFNAARAQLITDVIRPALERGAVVISTRFADSTIAYQGYGAGLPIDDLLSLESLATSGLEPDVTVVLDVPAAFGLRRKRGGEVTRFEADMDLAFHERVRQGFLAIAAQHPARVVVVDATGSLDDVADAVLRAVVSRVPGLGGEPARPRERIHP